MADQKRLWASVGKPRDGKWEMIPSEVNAYYNPSSNEVVFPAGILQNPYFNKDWPEYLVYGSFGAIAGHELSHAFDSTGRQYNAEGKLTDWWSKSTIKRFEKLKQCFLKQYANYTIIENGEIYHVNSELTIGEDMADSGGLAQAYVLIPL
jgi:endothelin-converting enzyme